jgi:hypothetical protein
MSCIRPGAASRVETWESSAWWPLACWFEGAADGRPYGAQRRAWQRLSAPYFPQCRGSLCSAWDGAVMAGMAEQGRW